MSNYVLTCAATHKQKGLWEIKVGRARSAYIAVTVNQGIGVSQLTWCAYSRVQTHLSNTGKPLRQF